MRRPTALAFACLAALPAFAAGRLEDQEPPPSDLGRSLVHYATIARNDGSFRRLWINAAALSALTPGSALPDGTTIAMETFYDGKRPATVFIKEKTGSQWLYGSFEPGQPDWTGMKSKTVCHACHVDAAADLTFTLPILARFSASGSIIRAFCDRSGRVPCDDAFYTAAGSH